VDGHADSKSPTTGTLFRASQFLSEELPIRLAHRVQELDQLPNGLNEMPSINRVKTWYAQSFEVQLKNSRHLSRLSKKKGEFL
jgi:pyruvate dehydrogenase kinase 2/3/4